MMRHFVLIGSSGQIVEHVMWGGDAPTPQHLEICDPESKLEVAQDIRRLVWSAGKIRSKPVVEFVASKTRMLADGSDEIAIEAVGLEPGHGPLPVTVNGVAGEVCAGEAITLTTKTPGTIRVSVRSETIFSEGTTVLAVVPT